MKKYRLELNQYVENQRIASYCNAITFVNNGTATVLINNFPVAPSATLNISGNENELDATEYDINFLGVVGDMWVIKKMYI